MIAASLRDAEGDPIIDLLLRKEADVNVKSTSGQVSHPRYRTNWNSPAHEIGVECPPLRNLQSKPQHNPHPDRKQMQRPSKR